MMAAVTPVETSAEVEEKSIGLYLGNPQLIKKLEVEEFGLDELESDGKIKEKFKLNEFIKLMDKSHEEVKSAIGKEYVLVLGNTGAGKSTTINYLMGCKMGSKFLEEYADYRAVVMGHEFAKIGHSDISETLYPNVHGVSSSRFFYCDCPGFIENRGPAYKISTTINTRAAIQSAKNVQSVIMVIDFDSLRAGKGSAFRELGSVFGKIFKRPHEMGQSVIFVFTKASKATDTKEFIVAKIKAMSKQSKGDSKESVEDMDAIKGSLAMFQLIIDNPENVFVIDIFDQGESRAAIVERLQALRYIPKFDFNFGQHDADQIQFDRFLFAVVSAGAIQLKAKTDLPIHIKQCQESIEEASSSIQFYDKQIEKLSSGVKIELSDEEKEVYRKRITENTQKIAQYDKGLSDLSKEINSLRKELADLSSSKEVILWESPVFSEERTAFFGWFAWSKKIFEYAGKTPYTKVELHQENGVFSEERQDKANGKYKVTYTSDTGKKGHAWVELYTEKRLKPQNQARIATITNEIAEKLEREEEYKRAKLPLQRENSVVHATLHEKERAGTNAVKDKEDKIRQLTGAKREREEQIRSLEQEHTALQVKLKFLEETVSFNMPLFTAFQRILFIMTAVPMGYHLPVIEDFLMQCATQESQAVKRSCLTEEDDLLPDFLCSIGYSLMNDPVSGECGHSFERKNITDYCESVGKNGIVFCPCCRNPIDQKQLRPNTNLKGAIDSWKKRVKEKRDKPEPVPTDLASFLRSQNLPDKKSVSAEPEALEQEKQKLEAAIIELEKHLHQHRRRYAEILQLLGSSTHSVSENKDLAALSKLGLPVSTSSVPLPAAASSVHASLSRTSPLIAHPGVTSEAVVEEAAVNIRLTPSDVAFEQ